MKLKIKSIFFSICLSMSLVHASVSDYQEIYQADQQAFSKEMSQEIKKQTSDFRGKVKAIYEAINYQSVWVDKDYLTHHTELLIAEIEEDFKKGLHQDLVVDYKKLLPDGNKVFQSDSLEDKAKVEIGIMKLYVKVINNILKDHKSTHTPLTLIQKALEEQDLMTAIDSISNERIMHAISSPDMNITKLKESQEAYQELTKRLMGKDQKDRLKALYELLEYQPIWITEEGLTSYTKELFSQIEGDITLDKNSASYREFKTIH